MFCCNPFICWVTDTLVESERLKPLCLCGLIKSKLDYTDFKGRKMGKASRKKAKTIEAKKTDETVSEKPSSTKFQHILSILLILLISIAIYSNTLKNGFVYDDEFTIVNNTLIKNFSNLSKLFTREYFISSGEMSYRPVVTFTYFIDYALYGLKPYGYHLTNLILHAMNGVILYIFLTLCIAQSSRLKAQGSKLKTTTFTFQSFLNPPLLISLIFITHPVLTEAVNAISFREDLLCFLFFISALILYISHRSLLIAHCSKFKAFSLQLSALSHVLYLLALLSKEMAITFPLVILLYEWIYGKQPPQSPLTKEELNGVSGVFQSPLLKGLRGLVPLNKGGFRGLLFNPYIIGYVAITCFYLYLRFFLFHNPVEESLEVWSLYERLITIPYLILKYIILLIAPVSLSADYVITPINSPFSPTFIVSMVIVILLLFTIYKLRQSNQINTGALVSPACATADRWCSGAPNIVFGILFLLITLIPVYNIIPIANPFTERYLYLPITGFTIAIGSILHLIFNSSWLSSHRSSLIAHCSLLIILSLYSFAVIQRNKIWLDGYSLWSDTVKKSPSGFKPHNNLGNVYLDQGRINEAIEEFQTALKLNPNYVEIHGSLGNVYLDQGRINEAIKEFQTALKLNSKDVKAHNNLGIAYEKQGQIDEAIKEYKLALTLNPNYAEVYGNLGNVYLDQGRINEAIEEYLAALKLNPNMVDAYRNLGNVYLDQGRINEAIKEFQTALKLNPNYIEAYNNLNIAMKKIR